MPLFLGGAAKLQAKLLSGKCHVVVDLPISKTRARRAAKTKEPATSRWQALTAPLGETISLQVTCLKAPKEHQHGSCLPASKAYCDREMEPPYDFAPLQSASSRIHCQKASGIALSIGFGVRATRCICRMRRCQSNIVYYVLDKPFAGFAPLPCSALHIPRSSVWLGRLSSAWCWSLGSGAIPRTRPPKLPLYLQGLHVLMCCAPLNRKELGFAACFLRYSGCSFLRIVWPSL